MLLSYDDTRRMLDNTVVILEGRLVYCFKVHPNLKADFVDLETGERSRHICDFDLLKNPKDSRIGYVNIKGADAKYIVRYAARNYRMGFSYENLLYGEEGANRRLPERMLGHLMEGLNECYHNIYPTFEEALKKAQATRKVVAYDRSFAIKPNGKVLYQGFFVGKVKGPHEADVEWIPKGRVVKFERQRPVLNWRK